MENEGSKSDVDLAASLTIAWLNNPNVRANTGDATDFLQNIHATLRQLGSTSEATATEGTNDGTSASEAVAAVSVRKSLGSRNHIISLIDGKPYVTLKRHLSSHGLTPQQYRERFGLKPDYPMVAPAYAEKRRELAKQIGLGRKADKKANVKPAGSKPKRRGPPPKAA